MIATVAVWLGLVAVLGVATPALAQSEADAKAAAQSIMQQLEAFRHDDYDTAYGFASAEIQLLFDRVAFKRMVRTGYPEIARSSFAFVARAEVAEDGHVHVRMAIKGSNGNSVEALYDMVRETTGWRINGVVTRPNPGPAV